jgi:hypothetical protein
MPASALTYRPVASTLGLRPLPLEGEMLGEPPDRDRGNREGHGGG